MQHQVQRREQARTNSNAHRSDRNDRIGLRSLDATGNRGRQTHGDGYRTVGLRPGKDSQRRRVNSRSALHVPCNDDRAISCFDVVGALAAQLQPRRRMRKTMSILLVLVGACAGELGPDPTPPSTSGGSNTQPGGGGDPGGGDPGGGTGMTATQFLTQMGMKYCDEAFACQASFPTDQGVTFADAFGASASECYGDEAAYDMPAQVEAEITAGKIHYDASAAAACVAGIQFGDCTAFWQDGGTYPAACDTALVGTVADGGGCVVDYDCSNVESVCDPTAHTCGPVPQGQ
jgi:hypothetical protein